MTIKKTWTRTFSKGGEKSCFLKHFFQKNLWAEILLSQGYFVFSEIAKFHFHERVRQKQLLYNVDKIIIWGDNLKKLIVNFFSCFWFLLLSIEFTYSEFVDHLVNIKYEIFLKSFFTSKTDLYKFRTHHKMFIYGANGET